MECEKVENPNTKLFNEDYSNEKISAEVLSNLLCDSGEKTEIKNNNKKSGKKSKRLISVIIATYNRKDMLRKCLNSILNQTYNNIEIFVIDDASSDDTETMMKDHFGDNKLITYIKGKKNIGEPSQLRRKAYDMSNGEYVIFFDDDDYYIDNNFFDKAVNILEKDYEIIMVASNVYTKYIKENKYVNSSLNISGIIKCKDYLEKFSWCYRKPYFAIFRKDNLDENGFADVKLVNDTAIYLRALISDKKVYVLDNMVGVYVISGANITFNIKTNFFIRTMEEKLQIRDYIETNINSIDSNKWFLKQITDSFRYYVFNNYNSSKKKEVRIIIDWIVKNIKTRKIITYIKFHLMVFKKSIRNGMRK